MVPGDAPAGRLLDEETGMGAGAEETGGICTPWSAWGSGLRGARRATPMVLAPAVRCGRRTVRVCGSGCQRRPLATK